MVESGKGIHGTVITANYQTQGKGQFGRTWDSRLNQNLLMTVIICPRFLPIDRQFDLNITASIAVARIISKYCEEVKIKWPNDIYIGKNKVAGILIQNFVQSMRIKHSVIGMGINIHQKEWDANIPNPTSISLNCIQAPGVEQLLDEICISMNDVYLRLKSEDKKLKSEYENLLYLKDEAGSFIIGEQIIKGRILGIDEEGKLLIHDHESVRACRHGEIKFII